MPKSTDRVMEILTDELIYHPTGEQRRAKATFWHRFHSADIPPCEPQDITLAIAENLVSSGSRLERWWSDPGFAAWFRNAEEFRERVEFLTHLALDAITDVLISEDPKMSSAKVNAAKLMLEVGRKMPKKEDTGRFLDDRIGTMTRKELEDYIAKNRKLLEPLDNPPTDPTEPT